MQELNPQHFSHLPQLIVFSEKIHNVFGFDAVHSPFTSKSIDFLTQTLSLFIVLLLKIWLIDSISILSVSHSCIQSTSSKTNHSSTVSMSIFAISNLATYSTFKAQVSIIHHNTSIARYTQFSFLLKGTFLRVILKLISGITHIKF